MSFALDENNAEQVLTAIRHFCFIQNWSQAKLIEVITEKNEAAEITAGKMKERKAFPPVFVRELEKLINDKEFTEFDRSFIDIKVKYPKKSLYSGVNIISAGLSFNSMNSWMKNRSAPSNEFKKICSKGNNQFLLLRAESEELISVSRMKITHMPRLHSTPLFITKRGGQGFDQRIVRGQIFQSGSSVFAIGQIKGSHTLRFTRLSFVEHPTRRDLYGIRCGHSALNNREYAHLVYAYQCNKFPKELLSIVRRGVSIRDPILKKYIPNFDAIFALLIPSGLSEMGLQTKA